MISENSDWFPVWSERTASVADPDFELKVGGAGGVGFVLLACSFSSFSHFFFSSPKIRGDRAPPLDPPLRFDLDPERFSFFSLLLTAKKKPSEPG